MRGKGVLTFPRLRLVSMLSAALLGVGIGTAHADEPPAAKRYQLNGDARSPDLSGLWSGSYLTAPGLRAQTPIPERKYTRWAPFPLPLTPDYQKKVDARAAAAKTGRVIGDAGVRCLPSGMPWKIVVNPGLPIEVIQTPGQVSFWGGLRPVVIYTDGRPHPADLTPTYDGHSIGWWVGDTLHVDTVGLIASTAIDAAYNPHSAALHLVWTLQRVAPDRLHLNLTVYDPEALKEPLSTTVVYELLTERRMDLIDDASCFENNRNLPDENNASGFKRF
ncbi:hypothetical protein [Sphingomonas bacterium]|uniref:hypothetical protein n=1 Tax=Sphingomonas bacterium TaxID=1895847 RepID=UPI001575FEAE|nr:hypothetical protein [Sphingomonas bacterium]